MLSPKIGLAEVAPEGGLSRVSPLVGIDGGLALEHLGAPAALVL